MNSHVFISHSHQDSATAERLHTALVRASIPASIDLVGLIPNGHPRSTIGKGTNGASAVVLVVSKSSISSGWIESELLACKESGIPVVPFKADDTSLPARLRLLLGDVLNLDGSDRSYAEGLVPKVLAPLLLANEPVEPGRYFPLGSTGRNGPHARCFSGAVETAWDEQRFGRTAIVLPTNQSIDLRGAATSSILEHLGIPAASLTPTKPRISSREVCVLSHRGKAMEDTVLMASTVFNATGRPCAEDQWRAAAAALTCAEEQRCTLVLVPPLGTGTFDWPVRQALVNWLYGAILWYRNNARVTARSVWPVLCVRSPADQEIMGYYLEGLSPERLGTMRDRRLTLRLRYQGDVSDELSVLQDVQLGAIARSAFSTLKTVRLRFTHGAGLRARNSGLPFDYDADTPLAKTIFADGDLIDAYATS